VSAKVEYHVEVDPTTVQINVTVEMSGDFVREGMTVCVPTWVAGDYSFETYARDVFELSASDPQSGADVAAWRTTSCRPRGRL
jgi:predicted metalloprotease with PDZ domain